MYSMCDLVSGFPSSHWWLFTWSLNPCATPGTVVSPQCSGVSSHCSAHISHLSIVLGLLQKLAKLYGSMQRFAVGFSSVLALLFLSTTACLTSLSSFTVIVQAKHLSSLVTVLHHNYVIALGAVKLTVSWPSLLANISLGHWLNSKVLSSSAENAAEQARLLGDSDSPPLG